MSGRFDVKDKVAYAVQHWRLFELAKSRRPWLRYVALLDDDTDPEHRKRHNLVLSVDHPYWDTWAPPCGRKCRCSLQGLSDRDIQRLIAEGEALFHDPPPSVPIQYRNRVTGETIRVPAGIEPGWDFNPGKEANAALVAAALRMRSQDWVAISNNELLSPQNRL